MEALLAIASLIQKSYGKWLFSRLVSGVVILMGLLIVIAIMVSAALIASLVASYFALVQFGVAPVVAIICVALLSIALIVFLVFLGFSRLRHLRTLPPKLFRQSPFTASAMSTLDAFTDGLMAE